MASESSSEPMTGSQPITQLPNEVLVRILHYCHYGTIVQFSETCRKSYEVVLQSVSLQLHIELDVTGLEIIDESNASYSSILAELQGFRDEYPDDNQLDRIQLIHLDSPVVPPPLDFKKKFNNSIVDVSQDLVVLVEYFQEGPSSVIANVHLHRATTGLPHSLAQLTTLTVRGKNLRTSPATDLAVMGSILAITFAGPEPSSNYCNTLIWDWKFSLFLGCIKAESSDADIAFFDQGHLLIFSSLPSPPQEPCQAVLLSYIIPIVSVDDQRLPQADVYAPSYPNIEPVLVLEFPKVHKTYQIQGYVLTSMPLLGDLVYRGSAKVVYSRATTIALQFWTELNEHMVEPGHSRPPKYVDYCVFVNTDRIFNDVLDDTVGETVRIPWSQWGAEVTRWFIDNDSLSADSINTFGSCYPIWDLDSNNMGQLLSIFEFNPQVVRQYIDTSGHTEQKDVAHGPWPSSRRAFGIEDLKAPLTSVYGTDMGQYIVADIIGSDTKTVINTGFDQPVESSLPCMVVTRVERMPRHAAWYIQGDCLVGVPITVPGRPHPPLSLYKLQVSQEN